MSAKFLLHVVLLSVLHACSQTLASEDEEYDDVTVSQMLSPKKNEMDATQILNNLLKEYDKKLRPDIGVGVLQSSKPPRRQSETNMRGRQRFAFLVSGRCALCIWSGERIRTRAFVSSRIASQRCDADRNHSRGIRSRTTQERWEVLRQLDTDLIMGSRGSGARRLSEEPEAGAATESDC
ncbi:hypothetical protein AMELA_G00185430 [Ameiurus melas]|uniref:Uncharacterized protein n=1 Tax=Ameiurus melas TaxID=219545 RepID=A0A7J6A7F9_AMEME|nr:hypothetical protein AMELA_G00185430 [Ameiurus melas]